MRRVVVVVVSLIAILGIQVAPVMAQAPAPKVTITGLLDFVANKYHNWPGLDVTDGGRDDGWYSRERGVFTLTGEVGRSKAVWAVELDFTNGAGANVTTTTFPGTTANMDLDGDVAGAVETKWLYVETPITGPGSILPFIPVSGIIRAGQQPARGHEYKVGILLGGDIPGIAMETMWAPNMRSTLTFVQIGEKIDPITAAGQRESWALLASLELEVFKGLTVKPTYAYASYDGGNPGTGNLGTEAKDGFSVNGTNLRTTRHTLGGDVRWTMGGFTLQPTFLVQLGEQEIPRIAAGPNAGTNEVDIRSWIFDTTAGYRIGPLNIEGRVMWTPGMGASHNVANGADVNYYQAINPAFAYMGGWTEIQTSGVDYATALLAGAPGVSLRQSPSYDKYGRVFAALAADYSVTPALTLKGLVNVSWTDEEVDTDRVLGATGLTGGDGRGDDRYLGTEVNLGLTYRFAPNVALDLIGAYLFAGDALNHRRTGGTAAAPGCRGDREGTSAGGAATCAADDVYKLVSRVRITF